MDDETYVAVDPENIPGKSYYSQKPGFETPIESKLKHRTKFFQKYLAWQAIDQNGNVPRPYITNGTINKNIYLKNCLKKRLRHSFANINQSAKFYFGQIWHRPTMPMIVLIGSAKKILNLWRR